MWKGMVDWPAFGGIHNGTRNIRAGACLDGIDIEFQPGQRLKACDHPHESLIGKSRIGIATANFAVRTREPGLLHVALRFLPPGDRPERRNERPPMLVHPDRVQPHLDMIAETRIVKTEHE